MSAEREGAIIRLDAMIDALRVKVFALERRIEELESTPRVQRAGTVIMNVGDPKPKRKKPADHLESNPLNCRCADCEWA